MRAAIIDTPAGDHARVMTRASGVFGTALWKGETLPSAGTEHDVDIEVGGEVDWREVVIEEHGGAQPEVANGELLLQGVVEDCDHAGALTLRVAGAVVLLETTGEPPSSVVGVVCRHSLETRSFPDGGVTVTARRVVGILLSSDHGSP